MKICTRCFSEKSEDQYYKEKDGAFKVTYCKSCVDAQNKKYAKEHRSEINSWRKEYNKLPEQAAQFLPRQQSYRKRNKEKVRDIALKYRYGISYEDFCNILKSQNERCFLCKTEQPGQKGWQLDHRHGCCPSGKTCSKCVRGVLCLRCNLALGRIEKGWESLFSNLEYLSLGSIS